MYSLAAIASQNAEENDFNGTRTKIDETFTMLYPVNGVTTAPEPVGLATNVSFPLSKDAAP